jgi:hypothetical protein
MFVLANCDGFSLGRFSSSRLLIYPEQVIHSSMVSELQANVKQKLKIIEKDCLL